MEIRYSLPLSLPPMQTFFGGSASLQINVLHIIQKFFYRSKNFLQETSKIKKIGNCYYSGQKRNVRLNLENVRLMLSALNGFG